MISQQTEFEITQHLTQKKELMNIVKPIFQDYVKLMYASEISDLTQLIDLYVISFILIIPDNVNRRNIKYLAIEYINKDIDFQYHIQDTNKSHSKEYMHKWLDSYLKFY